jgi:hypothetical protein
LLAIDDGRRRTGLIIQQDRPQPYESIHTGDRILIMAPDAPVVRDSPSSAVDS